jgi:alpha-glucoside transport system substrate-binding protein
MRRFLLLAVVAATMIGLLAAPAPAAAKKPAPEPVTVLGFFDGDPADAFVAELETVAKGRYEIIYEAVNDDVEMVDRVTGEDPADLIVSPIPGLLTDLAEELVDLGEFVNPRSLRRDYGDYLIDVVTVDGAVLGGPVNAITKSLVWYQPDVFDAAGYDTPSSFAELVALSDQMLADGETPWCNYIESGGDTGWMGTDWVEDLLLGTDGPGVYDQWVDHDVLFVDPRVDDAFDRYQQMIDTAGYVYDRGNMTNLFFFENSEPLDVEDCLMHKQGAFFADILQSQSIDLDDFAAFKFPSVNEEFADAVMGGADHVAALNERKEVRELTRYILSQRFGRQGLAGTGGWILPNVRFDTRHYMDDLIRSQAEDIQAAIRGDQFRYDGSDMMPPEVGQGEFWFGIRDLVDGVRTVPEVLVDIDAAWPS